MGKLMNVARAHAGAFGVGAALLVGGGSVAVIATAPMASVADVPVYEAPTTVQTTEPAPTTQAPAPAPAPAPEPVPAAAVEQPVSQAPAATVEPVTEPVTPQPEAVVESQLPEGWSPPRNPGEPPVMPEVAPPSAEKLPAELAYVPPTD